MQELQTEFDKLDLNGADKPRQTRFLRSQQSTKQKQEQTTASSGGGAAASVAVDDVEADGLNFSSQFEFVCKRLFLFSTRGT